MKSRAERSIRTVVLTGSAAAVCIAAPAAHAQSSVTIYGIMDAGIEYTNHAAPDGGNAFKLKSGNKNTSRWGLRGVEDLGGGLKAVFRLESGIDLANGASDDGPDSIFARRATVGLKGKWGEVTLGRNFTVTYDYMMPFDPMGYSQNYSWASSSMATGGRKDGIFSRSSNAVRYDGEFSGFKFGALYGFGNVPGSMKTSSKYDFALGYETGPFAAVVTFDRQNGAAGAFAIAQHGEKVGVSRDFAGYGTTQVGVTAGIQQRF